ncbi:MAG: hypothetical protein AB9917_01745 [Negativicutes bacterium]
MRRDRFTTGVLMLVIAVVATFSLPVEVFAATENLSADYKLKYSVVDAGRKEQFSIRSDDAGKIEVLAPFISGGCIAINEVKMQPVAMGEDGIQTVNLVWNSDRGAPCKGFMQVQLKANFELPKPGRYLIQLWETERVNSTKIRLVGKQEVVIKEPQDALKTACRTAAIKAIKLEMSRAQAKNIRDTLEADLEKFQQLSNADYTLPEKVVETVWVQEKADENAILYVNGMSRSGPWYHLSGIVGGDYARMKPGVKYTATYYKVYPRAYWRMSSAYVCVAAIQ